MADPLGERNRGGGREALGLSSCTRGDPALHAVWTIKALRAGKHVLCEKPFASNALEAAAVLKVVNETKLVCVEAFHYRFSPGYPSPARDDWRGGPDQVCRNSVRYPLSLHLHNDIRYDVRGTDRSLAGDVKGAPGSKLQD